LAVTADSLAVLFVVVIVFEDVGLDWISIVVGERDDEILRI
jgi:hypothetical protein